MLLLDVIFMITRQSLSSLVRACKNCSISNNGELGVPLSQLPSSVLFKDTPTLAVDLDSEFELVFPGTCGSLSRYRCAKPFN